MVEKENTSNYPKRKRKEEISQGYGKNMKGKGNTVKGLLERKKKKGQIEMKGERKRERGGDQGKR